MKAILAIILGILANVTIENILLKDFFSFLHIINNIVVNTNIMAIGWIIFLAIPSKNEAELLRIEFIESKLNMLLLNI